MHLRGVIAVFLLIMVLVGCAVNPLPLKQDEMLNRATNDLANLYKGQEPITAPISLEESMARALKYNLDHRLKLMEDALALRQLDLSKYDMLPRIVAAAGYNARNNYNAASSMNVFTDQQSLAPSTSTDKNHYNADLTLTWNILDFGVSYFQARQQADRAMIMTERRRKVVHTIIQQIRHSYWLALGAQQLEGRFEPLLKEVEQALKDSKRIEAEKLRAPMETLTYQKTLLEILRQLEAFRDELSQAKTRLASLINLPPGQSFRLIIPPAMDFPKLPEGLEQMEYRALLMRPEIREADYNDRISAGEVRKSIARMFPGIELSAGMHYDSNSYLVWNNWFEGGVRVTWNLLNLLSGPIQYKVATAQTEITAAQRLALSMAVLTQVHLSYHDFLSRQRQYDLSRQLQEIETNIHQQTKNAMISGAQSRLVEIRAATTALMAEFRSYQNYAALQNAYGQIIATLGVDPLPETVGSHDIKTLANAIQTSMKSSWTPIPIDEQRLKKDPRQGANESAPAPAASSGLPQQLPGSPPNIATPASSISPPTEQASLMTKTAPAPEQQAAANLAGSGSTPMQTKENIQQKPVTSPEPAVTAPAASAAPAEVKELATADPTAAPAGTTPPPAEKIAMNAEVAPAPQAKAGEPGSGEKSAEDNRIAAPAFGCYSIQAAALYSPDEAVKTRDALRKKGYPAEAVKMPGNVNAYSILVYRFPSRQEALKYVKTSNISRKLPGSFVRVFCPAAIANK